MSKFVWAALAVAAATVASAAPKGDSVEATIRKLDAAWNQAAKKLNADAWDAFYAPNAVVFPPNEPVADTPAKIKKSMTAFLGLPNLKVSWTCDAGALRTRPISGSDARYMSTVSGPSSSAGVSPILTFDIHSEPTIRVPTQAV